MSMVEFVLGIQDYFTLKKLINYMTLTEKKTDHSIYVQKASDEIQHLFNIKNSQETRNRKTFYQSDKWHQPKPTANITNIEKTAKMSSSIASVQIVLVGKGEQW